MFCTKCGRELNSGDRFCAGCGTEVKVAKSRYHNYEDVVFNPPFKLEADKRTSEILKTRDEFTGFKTLIEREEPPKPARESISFNWNLDGLPPIEPRKTEEVDFNWGAVIEKKKTGSPIEIEKIKFEPVTAPRMGDTKDYDRVDFTQALRIFEKQPSKPKAEVSEPVRDRFESVSDLETELFGKPSKLEFNRPETKKPEIKETITYEPLNEDLEAYMDKVADGAFEEPQPAKKESIENKLGIAAGLGAFLFGNRETRTEETKKPAPEETRISRDYSSDFPEIREEFNNIKEGNEPKDAAITPGDLEVHADYADALDSDINNDLDELDFLFGEIEEEKQKTVIFGDAPGSIRETAPETITDEAPKTFEDAAKSVTVVPSLSEIEELVKNDSEAASNNPEKRPTFYTFTQKNETFEKLLELEKKRLEELGADYKPLNQVKADKKKAEMISKTAFVSVASPARTMALDATGEIEQLIEDVKKEPKLTEAYDRKQAEEKARLRYSDIFPKEVLEAELKKEETKQANIPEQKTEAKELTGKAKEINDYLDSIEPEREKKHILGKILIAILILLIVAEGAILGAKFLAPDSKISEYGDVITEKAISWVMSLGFNKGDSGDSQETATDTDETMDEGIFWASLISSQIEDLKTVGSITYSEDSSLKYSALETPAVEGVKELPAFEDSDFYTSDSGEIITTAEYLILSLKGYYESWQDTNKDETLVGINKVEIGDVKQNGNMIYVLTRITYADKDGGEKSVTETIIVQAENEVMRINSTKEETIVG